MSRLPGMAVLFALCALAAARCSAAPPFPGLLEHYPKRPPWKVAGVDVAAGVPAGTILNDPATLHVPGVTLDGSRHIVTVSGDDAIVDAIDFSGQGGWGIIVLGHNDIISRCNFRVGANSLLPIDASRDAAYLTVSDSTIDGGGAGRNPDSIYAVLTDNGTGLTVLRDWFRYMPVDAIDFNGSGTLIVRDSLFHDLGYSIGAHADSVQFTRGAVQNAVITGNTVFDPQPTSGFPVPGGEGLQVEAQLGGSIRHTLLARNVIVASGPRKTAGYLIAIRQDAGSLLDDIEVADNYLDATGGWGPFYPPSGTRVVFRGNVDLRSGKIITPKGQ